MVQKDERGVLSWTGKVVCRPDRLYWPFTWRKPRMIFVPSLGDLFHPAVPDDFIDQAFAVFALTPRHTYQVLTRRSDRMRAYLNDPTIHARLYAAADRIAIDLDLDETHIECLVHGVKGFPLPLANVWLGASVPNRATAIRLYGLSQTPAALRFVSYEPALEGVDFERIELEPTHDGRRRTFNAFDGYVATEMGGGHWFNGPGPGGGLGWGIIGGESIRRRGKTARPFRLEICDTTIGQFRAYGVPLFVKQLGHNPVHGGPAAGTVETGYPVTGKGVDPAEWPAHLRVQQFPVVRPS